VVRRLPRSVSRGRSGLLRAAPHQRGGLLLVSPSGRGPPGRARPGLVWAFNYLLYVVYTTSPDRHDLLPAVLPGRAAVSDRPEVVIPFVLCRGDDRRPPVALLVNRATRWGNSLLALTA